MTADATGTPPRGLTARAQVQQVVVLRGAAGELTHACQQRVDKGDNGSMAQEGRASSRREVWR
jgi:hypothetical protein